MEIFHLIVILVVTLVNVIDAAPHGALEKEHANSFWFGVQDLECLKGKGLTKVRRSAPERSTIRYSHRLLYYNGTVFEWGNGVKGYHYGPQPSISDCELTWENEPAGNSTCSKDVVELFTKEYRRHYGGYNLLMNNCHHFVNRIAIILTSDDCNIKQDRWSEFSDNMWALLRRFTAVFKAGTLDRPQEIRRASSRDPTVHNDWPIVQWY